MKKAFALLVWVLAVPSLPAQVAVETRLDQDQFLAGESIVASVRISNRSGQSLEFGKDADWLSISIETYDGKPIEPINAISAPGEFKVNTSIVATRPVEVTPHFPTLMPGRYKMIATVKVKEWNTEITAPPKPFDIVRGAKLWSEEFGLPPADGATNRSPEMRRYTLEQANYLRKQLRLYFRLTNPDETRVFKVQAVGPMISFSSLEQQLDRTNNLHALWRTGSSTSTYVVFNTDGEIIKRQTYELIESKPKLKLDETGTIYVSGANRKFLPSDIPAPPNPDLSKSEAK